MLKMCDSEIKMSAVNVYPYKSGCQFGKSARSSKKRFRRPRFARKKDVHVKEKIDSGDFTEQSHSHMTLQASLKLFISVLHCLGLSRGLPCETTDRTFSCESLWP